MTLFEPSKPDVEPETNFVELVRRAVRTNTSGVAVVCGDERVTWATFDRRINRVANMLLDLGIERGDRVAVLGSTSIAYLEIFMGTLRAGACIVPLSTMAASEALLRMMNDCGAKVLFISESMKTLAEPFAGELELVENGLVALDFEAAEFAGYELLMEASAPIDPDIAIDPGDLFNIIYSSGTTGVPKGILHDHWMRAVQMARYLENGYDENARTLLSTPLYSNTTIVVMLPTLAGGGTIVLMPKFDARGYLELVEQEHCTHTMLVPVQYKRIMDVPDFDRFDLSSMREKFSTSAPLRADVKDDVLTRFPGGLTEYYGLTEGGGYTILKAHENPDKLDTVGQPGPTVELKFIDDEGLEVPPGKPGEICGRSAAMMRGYYNAPDKTAEYLWTDRDGRVFFRSGDMGVMDDDGFLHLTDRKKDMIISGGLNIFANDLELALLAEPDVSDAAVIGIPSEHWGETPLGLVVLNSNTQRCADEILESTNRRLGKSQRLSGVELRDHLPRSSIGKILKRELREPYWKEVK